jgi:predicted house-cleaning NTP pyrophosphatase (Maf/HAM1 superfamily)
MTEKIPTASVSIETGKNFLIKAREFLETMESSLANRKWNAAALNAIHAGISACDAVTTVLGGVRSKSQKHEDAVKVLKQISSAPGTTEAAGHLHQLLRLKHNVEYEGRLFVQTDAVTLAKHARRFVEWAGPLVG